MSRISVLIVGNFLSGAVGNCGACEELAPRLSIVGFHVITTSRRKQPVLRLLDMLRTVWKYRNHYDLAQVAVFSGRSFIWAEAVCGLLRRLHRPYILTLHGGALPQFGRKHKWRVERLLRSAAAVTVPSRYLLKQMTEYRQDLILLPNGLDLSLYPDPHVRAPLPHLVWLRAFHNIYNPVMAVRVVARLKGEFPSIHLSMVGPDKRDSSLQKTMAAAKEYGVEEHVDFLDPVPKRLVPRALQLGDIFLNTTTVDNTPVSVLEAMAAGARVVSTNVGGIPYLLQDGVDALLVPSEDDTAMADAVRRLLLDRELADRLQQQSRAKLKAYHWDVVLPQWEELIRLVAAQNRECAPITSVSRSAT